MNILLIQPRRKGVLWLGGLACIEPLGLENIAAPLQQEHNLKLVDFFEFKELSLDCTPMTGQIRLGESGGVSHYSPD